LSAAAKADASNGSARDVGGQDGRGRKSLFGGDMATSADSTLRFSYELLAAPSRPSGPLPADDAASEALPETLLIGNVLWFIRLRWVSISCLFVFGAMAFLPYTLFAPLGLRPPNVWPFVAGGILFAANLGFLWHAEWMVRQPPGHGAVLNLWSQIIVDLVVLTILVHFLGSLQTPAPFMYLGHVVLACIFFRRRQSLGVVLISSGLYAGCVGLELLNVIQAPGVYADPTLRNVMVAHFAFPWVTVLSALGIFFVVWYLASHLAAMVRGRDRRLAEANRRLTIVQAEKARHMLRTTHELKAPFAAIAANAQLLLKGSFGVLPDEAAEVVRRIAARCRRLAHEIQQMLQLANLQSENERPLSVELDLADIVRWTAASVGALAQERRVTIETQLAPARVRAAEDHIKMLVSNVVSNAVVYSHTGGRVRVTCLEAPPRTGVIVVEDEGIGIPQSKLPRIFDDYYRTDEAVRHTRDSTGLGLAIVRHIAQTHGIRVRVESEPGRGTRFTLRFPPPA
jgi:two-component system phosphate regulon sensor histidine kinase PhoR